MPVLTIIKKLILLLLVVSFFNTQIIGQQKNKPIDNQELYNTIVRLDSIFFDAYNNCKMDVQDSLYADSIEFYHDKGGLSTSKKDILTATKNNICGKVSRELINGSIEVSPINNYGAVEIGMHRFHNNQEPEANQSNHQSRFIIIWHYANNTWKIARVISLH